MTTTVHPLISVHPEELRFKFELAKQSHCDLKIVNKTEHHVAFKVKTTSPRKSCVRPNTSVIQPWDACFIRITLQAQREYPPDMQCKDKFLLQSTIVPPNTDVKDLAPDTFNEDAGRTIEQCKLRVVYVSPNANDNGDESRMKSSRQSLDRPSPRLRGGGGGGVLVVVVVVVIIIIIIMTTTIHPLISVHPEELRFKFELEKQSHCDLKIVNNTEHHVAFKVKTTSPKKYFVRPNTSVIQPWDACFIRITLQAQQEYPHDMQCKDKFLLQSTIVPPNTDVEDLAPDAFNKDAGRTIEECKLRVVYVSPNANDNGDESGMKSSRQSLDSPSNQALQQLKDERDAAMRQTQLLHQELDMLRRRRNRKNDSGFSFKFALIVALIGLMVGFLLNLTLSAPST